MEGENLIEKIDKGGFGEVKTLNSDVPTSLDFKGFNYDNSMAILLIIIIETPPILRIIIKSLSILKKFSMLR